MNIQQFQYVTAVVDIKNFKAAAEKCFVSQSTLSAMIGKLEEELGVKIFDRKTKPVSITPEGVKITERLRVILNEIDLLENMVTEMKDMTVNGLRIGIIPTIAPYLLPLFFNVFSARFPKDKIMVKEQTTAKIKKDLILRNIDVGIVSLPICDRKFIERRVFSEPFLIYDCTGDSRKNDVAVEDLDYTKVCLIKEGNCMRSQVTQLRERFNNDLFKDVNYTIESDSVESLIRITNMRKGITLLPYLASIDLSAEEQQKISMFKNPVPVRDVGLLTHKFFVKHTMLKELEDTIKHSVEGLFSEPGETKVLEPLV